MRVSIVLPLVISFIIIMSIGTEQVFAQQKTWLGRDLERQIQDAGFGLAPFRARAQFVLRNVEYDSIVYYEATDELVKDYTFTVGPVFNGYLPLKNRILSHIYESAQYVYFKETQL